MGKSRRPALDGIRAFAILAVFASHAVPHAGAGWIGVEVFFVLSGYLITGLLLRERQSAGQIAFGKFYMRRALRLYPALLLILMLGLIFYRELGDGGTLSGYGRTAAAAGLYVQDFVWGFSGAHGGFGHTWSLAVEEQFYLLWPPALALLSRRPGSVRRVALAGAVASLVVTAFLDRSTQNPPGAYFLPWVQASLLLAGCALATVNKRPGPRLAALLSVVGAGGLLGVLLVAGAVGRAGHLTVLLASCAVFSCALIAGVDAQPAGLLARFLAWRPIEYLGRISYGWYLYYLVVIELVDNRFDGSWPVAAAIELVLITSCALASYHMVELPFLRLKRRFETQSAEPALAGPRHALDSSQPEARG